MIASVAPNAHKVIAITCLLVAIATESSVSAGFSIQPSSPARQGIAKSFRVLGRKTPHSNSFGSSTVIRGGSKHDEESKDWGAALTGLFGNLRIPASLIAGASLGSAFSLPMLGSDGSRIGFAKRMYAFSMLSTLGSMLLVVILSTIVMNDVAIHPARTSESLGDYIDEHYCLEWMLVRSHFYYGTFAFVGGTAFRSWISVACPIVGRIILGVLFSLGLVCFSFLIEKTRGQVEGKPIHTMISRFVREIGAKSKTNLLFGAGVASWVTTVIYLIIKIPHIYLYLIKM